MSRSMVISLIGRPNVGKSSIFNALMRRQGKAITFDTPGVTRDRHYGMASLDELSGHDPIDVILVDTGGFYPQKQDEKESNDHFFNIMAEHARVAISESDLVLLVVDVREGLLPFDQAISDFIRQEKRPFWVLANKFDSSKQEGSENEFFALGIDDEQLMSISAAHGIGLSELRTRLQELAIEFAAKDETNSILQKGVTPREEVVARIAIIGAPNAGKSTLLNQLVGSERALVSPIPGTTVDPIEGFFDLYFGPEVELLSNSAQVFKHVNDQHLIQEYDDFRKNNPDIHSMMNDKLLYESTESLPPGATGQSLEQFAKSEDSLLQEIFDPQDTEEQNGVGSFWRSIHIVDTAGIRKKSAIDNQVEEQAVYRALRAISESDLVVFMVDATKGIGHQDRRLLDIALEKGKSLIVCLNKMDLMEKKFKTNKEKKEWALDLRAQIPWLDFCDLVPISAKYRKCLGRLRDAIRQTILVRHRKISTGELNRAIYEMIERHSITLERSGGKRLRVKYASMVKADPPTVLLFCNGALGIPDSFHRYIQNGIRRTFKLINTPIHVIFRTGKDLEQRREHVK